MNFRKPWNLSSWQPNAPMRCLQRVMILTSSQALRVLLMWWVLKDEEYFTCKYCVHGVKFLFLKNICRGFFPSIIGVEIGYIPNCKKPIFSQFWWKKIPKVQCINSQFTSLNKFFSFQNEVEYTYYKVEHTNILTNMILQNCISQIRLMILLFLLMYLQWKLGLPFPILIGGKTCWISQIWKAEATSQFVDKRPWYELHLAKLVLMPFVQTVYLWNCLHICTVRPESVIHNDVGKFLKKNQLA